MSSYIVEISTLISRSFKLNKISNSMCRKIVNCIGWHGIHIRQLITRIIHNIRVIKIWCKYNISCKWLKVSYICRFRSSSPTKVPWLKDIILNVLMPAIISCMTNFVTYLTNKNNLIRSICISHWVFTRGHIKWRSSMWSWCVKLHL